MFNARAIFNVKFGCTRYLIKHIIDILNLTLGIQRVNYYSKIIILFLNLNNIILKNIFLKYLSHFDSAQNHPSHKNRFENSKMGYAGKNMQQRDVTIYKPIIACKKFLETVSPR